MLEQRRKKEQKNRGNKNENILKTKTKVIITRK